MNSITSHYNPFDPMRGANRAQPIRRSSVRSDKQPKVTKKQVRQMIKSVVMQEEEPKALDSNISYTGTYATDFNVSIIPIGTAPGQRTGSEVEVKQIELRYSATISDTTNLIRVIIYQWHPSGGQNSRTYTDILSYNANLAPVSPYKYDNRTDFTIFYDSGPIGLSADYPYHADTIVIKRNFGRLLFDATNANSAGALHVVVMSDSGATPNPAFSGFARIIYTDS